MAGSSQPGPIRMVATLALAGLCSGLVLVGVFLATQPRILQNRAEALNAAIYAVLPGTEEIRAQTVRDGALVAANDDTLPAGETVYAGYDADGKLIGYAVPAAGPGFMDTIQLLYGYDPESHEIIGLQVLESRETPGLGDKIITDEDFAANFDALAITPEIVPVKKGEKSRPNEVDCITGATISSEAVVSILNASTRRWAELLAPQERNTIEVTRHVADQAH
jgi:electron transport complex protein RnfG